MDYWTPVFAFIGFMMLGVWLSFGVPQPRLNRRAAAAASFLVALAFAIYTILTEPLG